MSPTDRPMGPGRLKGLILTTVALFIILLVVNEPLKTAAAPQGMISFQLAATLEQSLAIITSWHQDRQRWAVMSLAIDFLFILVYLVTLVRLTGYCLSDRPGVREQQIGRWVRALFVAAGISDVGENILLLNNLAAPSDTLSLAATGCALMKFTGLLLGAAGLVVIRAGRRNPVQH